MEAISSLMNHIRQGAPAILVTGRSLEDLDIDRDGVIRPLRRGLRRMLRDMGFVLIEYSRSLGLDWHQASIEDQRDRDTIESVLQRHNLFDVPDGEHESTRIFRGLDHLLRTPHDDCTWATGDPMRIAVLVRFGHHVVPDVASGMHTDEQVAAVEVTASLADSLALQSSDNLFLVEGRSERMDPHVCDLLLEERLPQPGVDAKRTFFKALTDTYDHSMLEPSVDMEQAANIANNTPNRSQTSLFRASHYGGPPVTAEALSDRKARDIEALSEGTLTLMSQDGVEPLVGKSIDVAQRLLTRCAEQLRAGRPNMPMNIVLFGPPGTGKTVMTLNLAQQAGVPACEMHSPKGSLVGETERQARLQKQVLMEQTPHIAFVDEISEALPMERSNYDGDGGASQTVGATLMSALSNENRRGRSLLVGTSNCPWRFGMAMLKRFTCIPVLFPVEPDYPPILAVTLQKVSTEMSEQSRESLAESAFVREAAQLFYAKKASARVMRAALENTMLIEGELRPQLVVQAARDFTGRTDTASLIHSELWSIKATTSKAFMPWSQDPETYPYPDHLDGVVDPSTGDIDIAELNNRIDEFEPYANV